MRLEANGGGERKVGRRGRPGGRVEERRGGGGRRSAGGEGFEEHFVPRYSLKREEEIRLE
jgi:hypothetical protein